MSIWYYITMFMIFNVLFGWICARVIQDGKPINYMTKDNFAITWICAPIIFWVVTFLLTVVIMGAITNTIAFILGIIQFVITIVIALIIFLIFVVIYHIIWYILPKVMRNN